MLRQYRVRTARDPWSKWAIVIAAIVVVTFGSAAIAAGTLGAAAGMKEFYFAVKALCL